MRLPHLLTVSALGAGLMIVPAVAMAQAKPVKPAKPPAAAATKPAPLAAGVDPSSVDALERMSSYLRTLNAFELRADLLTDEVLEDGRKLQFASTATYRVRKPNGFTIDLVSDRKVRKLIYDGKNLTLSSPRVGYYAQVSAPPTIRQTLDVLDKYDVEVPLEDLFHWGEPGDHRAALTKGFYVGPARIGALEADQYAYSTGDLDWQIWIQRGATPLPLKIIITSLFDDAEPQFSATMNWNTKPTLTNADFTFTPPADAKSITFAASGAAGQ